jgi:hypothetical protein
MLTRQQFDRLTTLHMPFGRTFGRGGYCMTCVKRGAREWGDGEPEPVDLVPWPCETSVLLGIDKFWAPEATFESRREMEQQFPSATVPGKDQAAPEG